MGNGDDPKPQISGSIVISVYANGGKTLDSNIEDKKVLAKFLLEAAMITINDIGTEEPKIVVPTVRIQ